MLALRDEVNKCLELARVDKLLGASLEAKVLLHIADTSLSTKISRWTDGRSASNSVDELRFFLLASQVELVSSSDEVMERSLCSLQNDELGVATGVLKADGFKCERCWHYHPSVESSPKYPGVCPRCVDSLSLMEFPEVAHPEVAHNSD